jgi:Concanavalin A-like lectin/glucanases superfamily
MADQQILVTGTSATPLTYTVPNAIEAALLCVNATIDGTAASGAFYATVEIVSDGGVVVARCPCFTSVAVGGTAEISWFRLRDTTATTPTPTTPYATVVFGSGGLQLYWKLDDAPASGTTKDSYGINDGTVYGTVTQGQPKLADVFSAQYVAGMSGKKVAAPMSQASQLMTCLVWLKTTGNTATQTVAWADTNAPNGRWFTIQLDKTGPVFVTIYTTAAFGVGFNGSIAVNDGLKHCVAFTYGATNPGNGTGAVGSIYIDGVLDSATALAMGGNGLAFTNQAIVIGAKWRNAFDDPAGVDQFVGNLDEFAVFNTTLTAAQIQAINIAGRV